MDGGGRRPGGPPVVVGGDASGGRRPSLWWAIGAVVMVAAGLWALQTAELHTIRSDHVDSSDPRPDEAPLRLQEVATSRWDGLLDKTQWTVSRVYGAGDGRGLAFTARSRYRHDLSDSNAVVSGEPARIRFADSSEIASLEWNSRGFGYTLIGRRLPLDELTAAAEGVAFDRIGLGSVVVPRLGYLPPDLSLLDQRAGPSGVVGTGTSGTSTTYQAVADPNARVTVVISENAVVTAAHLRGLFRLTQAGSGELAFSFPPTAPGDQGVRWLVLDRGKATIEISSVGLSIDDLARVLADLDLG